MSRPRGFRGRERLSFGPASTRFVGSLLFATLLLSASADVWRGHALYGAQRFDAAPSVLGTSAPAFRVQTAKFDSSARHRAVPDLSLSLGPTTSVVLSLGRPLGAVASSRSIVVAGSGSVEAAGYYATAPPRSDRES